MASLTGKGKATKEPDRPLWLPDHDKIIRGIDGDPPCLGPMDAREWTPEEDERGKWQQIVYKNPWSAEQVVTCWVHREFLSRSGQRRYQTLTQPTGQLNKPRADIERQFNNR